MESTKERSILEHLSAIKHELVLLVNKFPKEEAVLRLQIIHLRHYEKNYSSVADRSFPQWLFCKLLAFDVAQQCAILIKRKIVPQIDLMVGMDPSNFNGYLFEFVDLYNFSTSEARRFYELCADPEDRKISKALVSSHMVRKIDEVSGGFLSSV